WIGRFLPHHRAEARHFGGLPCRSFALEPALLRDRTTDAGEQRRKSAALAQHRGELSQIGDPRVPAYAGNGALSLSSTLKGERGAPNYRSRPIRLHFMRVSCPSGIRSEEHTS